MKTKKRKTLKTSASSRVSSGSPAIDRLCRALEDGDGLADISVLWKEFQRDIAAEHSHEKHIRKATAILQVDPSLLISLRLLKIFLRCFEGYSGSLFLRFYLCSSVYLVLE